MHNWKKGYFYVPNCQGFHGIRPIPETTQKHNILMTYNWKFPLDLDSDYEFVLAFLRQIDFTERDFWEIALRHV